MSESTPASSAGCPTPLALGAPAMNSPAVPSPASPVKPAAPVRPLDPRAVAAVLAGIRSDSQREHETFLRDTEVPYGGE